MIKVGKRGLVVGIAMCLILTFALAITSNAALFGLIKVKSKSKPVVRQSLMIFPFDKDAETTVSDELGQSVAEYLISTLTASKGYSVILFDDRLTPVRRALADNAVKTQDLAGPFFTDKVKAGKLAELLSTDYYMTGSIESYTYDKAGKTASLTLRADLINGKTGKLFQEFMVGGTAAQGAQALDEEELQSIAAGKAVEALCQKVLETSAADKATAAKPKPKK